MTGIKTAAQTGQGLSGDKGEATAQTLLLEYSTRKEKSNVHVNR